MKENDNEVLAWFEKADHDLGTAIITYLHLPDYYDTITFHCQQALEKYLKAFLVFQDKEFKYTHDLVYLFEIIKTTDSFLDSYYDKISILQSCAVEVRYPNETIFLSEQKVIESLNTTKQIRSKVIEKIGKTINYNKIIDTEIC